MLQIPFYGGADPSVCLRVISFYCGSLYMLISVLEINVCYNECKESLEKIRATDQQSEGRGFDSCLGLGFFQVFLYTCCSTHLFLTSFLVTIPFINIYIDNFQLLREFQRYKELVKRPSISKELAPER